MHLVRARLLVNHVRSDSNFAELMHPSDGCSSRNYASICVLHGSSQHCLGFQPSSIPSGQCTTAEERWRSSVLHVTTISDIKFGWAAMFTMPVHGAIHRSHAEPDAYPYQQHRT